MKGSDMANNMEYFELDEQEAKKLENSPFYGQSPPPPPALIASSANEIPTARDEDLEEEQKFVYTEELWHELEHDPWYHGSIPLDDVKELLVENGDFLIRKLDTETKYNQLYTLNNQTFAPTLKDVVKQHIEKGTPLIQDVVPKKPVAKQEWELMKEHITMQEKIGEGCFGEVWRARLLKRGKLHNVAVKLVRLYGSLFKLKVEKDDKAKERAEKMFEESRLMRLYDNANVIKLHGMVFCDKQGMIVMELVSGGSLDKFLQEKPVSSLTKASFAFDLASGMTYLHSKNCLHRDVAARNCLVEADGKLVKLSDFGMAVHNVPNGRYKIPAVERIPIRWQAPEVVYHFLYQKESDVYSYGMVLWELWNNGAKPFGKANTKEIRAKLSDPAYRPPIPKDCYAVVQGIMERCWDQDPYRRPLMRSVKYKLKQYCIHKLEQTDNMVIDLGKKKKKGRSRSRNSEGEKNTPSLNLTIFSAFKKTGLWSDKRKSGKDKDGKNKMSKEKCNSKERVVRGRNKLNRKASREKLKTAERSPSKENTPSRQLSLQNTLDSQNTPIPENAAPPTPQQSGSTPTNTTTNTSGTTDQTDTKPEQVPSKETKHRTKRSN